MTDSLPPHCSGSRLRLSARKWDGSSGMQIWRRSPVDPGHGARPRMAAITAQTPIYLIPLFSGNNHNNQWFIICPRVASNRLAQAGPPARLQRRGCLLRGMKQQYCTEQGGEDQTKLSFINMYNVIQYMPSQANVITLHIHRCAPPLHTHT